MCVSRSAVSDSLQPHGLLPARLLCPQNAPGKDTGVDCHSLLQGNLPDPEIDPWVGKIPWRRTGQPTPVFLPGESHGQSSLAGNSPWGCKESDTAERLSIAQHLVTAKPHWGFPRGSIGKEPACQCRRHKRYGFHPWVGKSHWSRK